MTMMCNQNDSSRQASADIFIWLLQVSRQSLGLSVDKAAHLAGMETAAWLAIESGQLPELNQMRPMAAALDLKVEQLAILDRMRRKDGTAATKKGRCR